MKRVLVLLGLVFIMLVALGVWVLLPIVNGTSNRFLTNNLDQFPGTAESLPVARFHLIPDTPYLFVKSTTNPDREIAMGHISIGQREANQRIQLINLDTLTIELDYSSSFNMQTFSQMSESRVLKLDDQVTIEALCSRASMWKPGEGEFYVFHLRPGQPIREISNTASYHSQFAVGGDHPFVIDIEALDEYQILGWEENQWKTLSTHAYQTITFANIPWRHGYTRDHLFLQFQSGFRIHPLDDFSETIDISKSDVLNLVDEAPEQNMLILLSMNSGWNFGTSNLFTDIWTGMNTEDKPDFSLLELGADGNLSVVHEKGDDFPFTVLKNDTVALFSPDKKPMGNFYIQSGESPFYALTREPGGIFNTERIEIDFPDGATVSRFPAGDEELLIYHEDAFWSMHWRTGEMKKLFPLE